MHFPYLDDDNFIMYAMKVYDNPQCSSLEEFYEDLGKIKYVKKLLRKYVKTGDIKERLILNHLIVFNNVFGPEATTRIMFLKLEPDLHSALKTFLFFLNILPEHIPETELRFIPIDTNIERLLKDI
jgi:hypothetical protein